MIDVKLYKDVSDASEVKRVEPGTPIYKIISPENKIAIVNGQEKPFDYILKENDVCIVRTIPEAAGLFIASVFIFIAATVAVGVGMGAYQTAERARKKAENLSDEIENIPYLKGASNAIATGRTQPYIIGRHLFTPYILSQPHYSISGTDGINQYYYLLLEGGFGKQVLEKLYADDVLIKTFIGATPHEGIYEFDAGIFYDENSFIEISQDGADFTTADFNKKYITSYPANELKKADDAEYADLIYNLPRNSRNVSVEINFKGLRAYKDSDGTKINRTVVVNPFYSLDDGETWTAFTFDQNGTPSNTFTRNTSVEMRFAATKEFLYSDVADIETPVKIKLVCPTNSYDGTALDAVTVSSIKTLCYDIDLSANVSVFVNEKPIGDAESALSMRIGICIKATEQNREKLNKINIITNGIARTWSGSEWSITRTPTSNLAAWVLEVLGSWTHGPSIVEDSEIDLDKFGEFYEYCETNGINANLVLTDGDEKTSVLTQLCNIGSSSLYENIYGEISIAWDAVKENAIAVLNAQNVLSFEVSREFSRETDGLLLNYICSSSDYQDDSCLIMRDGVTRTSDSIIQELSIKGITDYQQLAIYARRLMAIEKLRRRKIKAQVGKEGLYYTPLEKLLVQHPALSIGLGSAEIKSTIIDGDNIIGVELYEQAEYNSAEISGYGVIIQSVSDTYCTPISVEYTALTNGRVTDIYFETPIALSETAIPHAGDILSWGLLNAGEFDLITSEMLISGIASNQNGYEIDLVDYNAAIYESGTIPDYTPMVAYKSEAGVAQNITSQIIFDEAAGATAAAIAATTSLAPAAIAQYNPAYTHELPDDPAGASQKYDGFTSASTVTAGTGCTISLEGSRIKITITASNWYCTFPVLATSIQNKHVRIVYQSSHAGVEIRLYSLSGGTTTRFASSFVSTNRETIDGYNSAASNKQLMINCAGWTIGDILYIDAEYIGTGAYLSPTLDTSGNGNHLTNTAAVPVDFNGRKWWAFNGASAYLLGTTGVLGATGIVWGRIRTPATIVEQYICGNSSGNTGFNLRVTSAGVLRAAVFNGSSGTGLGATALAASTEYTFALVFTATTAALYIDGVSVATATVAMAAGTGVFVIGRVPSGTAYYWGGYIGDFYVSPIIPTAAQIRDLYYNGPPAELYNPAYIAAQSLALSGPTLFAYASGATVPVPTNVTLTATPQAFTATAYQWQYYVAGWNNLADESGKVSGAATANLTIYYNATVWGTAKTLRLRCVANSAITKEISLAKIADGQGISIKGTVAEPADLADIVSPSVGDIYSIGSAGTYGGVTYAAGDGARWDGSAWVNIGAIQGPAGLNAPRYLGVGLLAADDNATFRLDTVDVDGDITTGTNVTAITSDLMVNHHATGAAIALCRWSGTEWVATTEAKDLDLAATDIRNLATGGILIPGITVLKAAIVNNLQTETVKFEQSVSADKRATAGSLTAGDSRISMGYDPAVPRWTAGATVGLGYIIREAGNVYVCSTAGTTGSTAPTWPESGTVSDNTAVWTYVSAADYEFAVSKYLGTVGGNEVWQKQFLTKALRAGLIGLLLIGGLESCAPIYSDPGRVWYRQESGFGDSAVRGVACGNGKWVAVDEDGKIAYSSNGETWTLVTSSPFGGSAVLGVAYGNGKWVAVGWSGKIAYSSNGETWTLVTSSPFGTTIIYGVAYGNGKWVAVGSTGKIAYSSNGETWTLVTSSPFGTTIIYGVAYGNGKWVAVGWDGKIAYSSNGETWTLVTSSPFGTTIIYGVTYGNGKWVAVGGSGKIAYSYSAEEWGIDAESPYGADGYFYGATYSTDQNRWVAFGYLASDNSGIIITSDYLESGMGFTSRTVDANEQAYYSLQDGAAFYPDEAVGGKRKTKMGASGSQITTIGDMFGCIEAICGGRVSAGTPPDRARFICAITSASVYRFGVAWLSSETEASVVYHGESNVNKYAKGSTGATSFRWVFA